MNGYAACVDQYDNLLILARMAEVMDLGIGDLLHQDARDKLNAPTMSYQITFICQHNVPALLSNPPVSSVQKTPHSVSLDGHCRSVIHDNQ